MKKILKYIPILLLLLINPFLDLIKSNDIDKVKYNLLELENNSLKEEIETLSNIKYNNYEYTISKILIKNLYNSNIYYLKSNSLIEPKHPVINDIGLIGITNTDNTLVPISSLTISIKVDNTPGLYKDNKIIINKELNIDKNTNIYTSGLTNLPSNLLIGTIDTCSIKDNNTICNMTLNPIDTNYCLILTEYTI